MKKIVFSLSLVLGFVALAFAQPRPADTVGANTAPKKPAPSAFKAKYEGGMFGYGKKETGTLKFDDANSRLVFFGKDQKEWFGIPYDALQVIYPNSQSVTSTGGRVIEYIPLPGSFLGGFIKKKRRYLIAQFADPDIENARGTLSFKIEDQELLDSVLQTLAEKAKLTQRGDAYYKPRPKPTI
jgi:hypothetical protein